MKKERKQTKIIQVKPWFQLFSFVCSLSFSKCCWNYPYKLTLSPLLPRFTLIVGDELIFPINEGMQLTKDKGVLDNVALSFTGKKALFQMIIEITAVVIALLHSRYIFELILSYSVCLPELYFVRCEFKEEISIWVWWFCWSDGKPLSRDPNKVYIWGYISQALYWWGWRNHSIIREVSS